MEKKLVGFMDTTLRDGQQSLIATRLKTDEILPIVEKLDKVGFHALEVWGGATFDACLRYLNEDPWERLRKIREKAPNSKLQMLFRGQNILGYKAYPDDIVEKFIRKSIENGIDILRIFDALNDIRNLESSVKAVKKENAHAQLCISYTLSDVHTLEYYINYAKQLENIGADSICIKDMAGLLIPGKSYELVKALKENVNIPIQLHSHCTSGMAQMTYLKAVEAGVDVIDTAMSALSQGTSQPATESMVSALESIGYETNLNKSYFGEINGLLQPIREEALKSGLLDPKVLDVDINTLLYQVPGGMLSNLISQLKQQNALDKFNEVLAEIPKVRKDLGYIPLVTPTSQIVGTQSVLNIITGERYKMVSNETKDIVRGMYGRTPVEIDQEIVTKILGENAERVTGRVADTLQPGLQKVEEEMKKFKEQEEDVLTYAIFPQIATEYFKKRQAKLYNYDEDAKKEGNVYIV